MRLTIYMKSGNKIRLRGVKAFLIDARGNEVVRITLRMYPFESWFFGERLILSTLDLRQVEAVTKS